MRLIPTAVTILLALGAVEATAYWWMHPAPDDSQDPVLVYRPGNHAQPTRIPNQSSQLTNQGEASAQDSSPPPTINHQPSTSPSLTPLPEVYQQAAPMLRCTSGQVFHTQFGDESVGLHLAFFEWDGADTGSVLEAFRHMPEACMGSIGMTLVEKRVPRAYGVGGEETADRRSEVGDQQGGNAGQKPATSSRSTLNPQLSTLNSPPSTSSTTLLFDHTVFREPGEGGGPLAVGPLVHAFRAVWVAGLKSADARQGIGGDDFDRLRTIRLKSAVSRFRPTHARVIQAAVRGAADGEAAWHAFEQTMLADLRFVTPNTR